MGQHMRALADLHGSHQNDKKARDEHHASVEQRIKYIEKCVGDSADKHEQHMKELAALKGQVGDAHGKLADVHGSFVGDKRARDEHHANVEQRIKYLEKCVGDSADKHDKHMKALADLQGGSQVDKKARDEHHANMEQRVRYLEKCVGDSADKHEQHMK